MSGRSREALLDLSCKSPGNSETSLCEPIGPAATKPADHETCNPAVAAELQGFEYIDNTIRPHFALGYRTPHKYLHTFKEAT